jgi:hypothetical protein
MKITTATVAAFTWLIGFLIGLVFGLILHV